MTPRPYAVLSSPRATLRFFLGDCLELMPALRASSVDAIATSPPYNLGIRYRSYADRLPHERYLEWTGAWIQAAAQWLRPEGSLFLNVGAKPTDPWTAIDIAQAARPHLQLQNTLHWMRLPDYCLRLHGLGRVKTVADPFLGLGSTAVACATLGVDFLGIELDEGYLKEAIERAGAALNPANSGPPPGHR